MKKLLGKYCKYGPTAFLSEPHPTFGKRRSPMKNKYNYLSYRRLLILTQEILKVLLKICLIILVIVKTLVILR